MRRNSLPVRQGRAWEKGRAERRRLRKYSADGDTRWTSRWRNEEDDAREFEDRKYTKP